MQFGPFNADEGSDIAPQFLEIGFAEHSSLLVAKGPPPDGRTDVFQRRAHAEGMEDAHAVGLQCNSCPNRRPNRIAFDKLRWETLPVESACKRESSDSSANDQNSIKIGHLCTSYLEY